MKGQNFLSGDILSAFLQTSSLSKTTHVFNPYLFQNLQDDDDAGLRRYIPDPSYRKCYLPVIRVKHWTAIIVDLEEKSLTQLDTLSKNTDLINIVRRGFNRIGYLINFTLETKQPIVQTDGHSCGIHVLDIFLRDDAGFFGGRPLTREMVSKHIFTHFGDQPISVDPPEFVDYGGGPGDTQAEQKLPVQQTILPFLREKASDRSAPTRLEETEKIREVPLSHCAVIGGNNHSVQ